MSTPLSVREAVGMYAAGWFPMDDEGAPELPWYAAHERAVLPLQAAARDALRHRLRRDVRRCADHTLRMDQEYPRVLALCATPPRVGDGVWITPRLQELYLELNAAGVAHSFELRDAGGELSAGILGVVLGRAAMLESMRRLQPAAGNALLVRTLDHLVATGIELCDIQMPTPHTRRLGAELIGRAEYERRLAAALR